MDAFYGFILHAALLDAILQYCFVYLWLNVNWSLVLRCSITMFIEYIIISCFYQTVVGNQTQMFFMTIFQTPRCMFYNDTSPKFWWRLGSRDEGHLQRRLLTRSEMFPDENISLNLHYMQNTTAAAWSLRGARVAGERVTVNHTRSVLQWVSCHG